MFFGFNVDFLISLMKHSLDELILMGNETCKKKILMTQLF